MTNVRWTALLVMAALVLSFMASACADDMESSSDRSGTMFGEANVGALPEEESAELAPSSYQDEEAAEDSGDSGSAPVAGASIDRKIIQTASLSLEVKAVSEAFQEVSRIAAGAGGFVASSSFSNEGEEQTASVTIRVPAERFQDVLASLRDLAVRVESEQSEANDVTEEYADLNARLRNLEATEAQYLEFLERAKDIGEVLQVQDRLNGVRGEIEQVQGRMKLLDNLSDLSTVTVHLHPGEEAAADDDGGGPDPAEAAGKAWDASLEALRGIATAIVAVAAFSWWLVPIVLVLAIGVRMLAPRLQGRNRE